MIVEDIIAHPRLSDELNIFLKQFDLCGNVLVGSHWEFQSKLNVTRQIAADDLPIEHALIQIIGGDHMTFAVQHGVFKMDVVAIRCKLLGGQNGIEAGKGPIAKIVNVADAVEASVSCCSQEFNDCIRSS